MVGAVRGRRPVPLRGEPAGGEAPASPASGSSSGATTPELAALPWEYLFDPVRGDFVALSAGTPLVRYIPLPESMPPLRGDATDPDPGGRGQSVGPRRAGRRARADPPQRRDGADHRPRVGRARRGCPGRRGTDFTEALLEGPWHILHFIGHGGFDENRQEGIVAFARPDGKADYKRATSLGRVLGDHEPLRLAVLNACESGRSDATDVFSSTAGTLVRKGTPGGRGDAVRDHR